MVHNNSTKNFDLLEAYKSVYTEQPCTLKKELVDPPADPQGEMGNYGPAGAPKKPQGGDHVRITGESEPKRKGRYRAAYEEYKKELASHYVEKFNEWVQSLADEGYDITKWEAEELIETYIQENNLWDSSDIIINELNRYEKETGKDLKTGKPVTKGGTMGGDDTHSKVMRHMHKVMGAGRMGAGGPIQPRGKKKDRGGPTPGPVQTPAKKVAMRRAAAKRSQEMQQDTRGT